jgi:hypothetical protein
VLRLAALVATALALPTLAACALPPAQDCLAYVACQAAVDDDVDTSVWDEGGSCWDLPDTARHCEAQCQVGLDALRSLPDPPAACLP